jgi:hypothetical protein
VDDRAAAEPAALHRAKEPAHEIGPAGREIAADAPGAPAARRRSAATPDPVAANERPAARRRRNSDAGRGWASVTDSPRAPSPLAGRRPPVAGFPLQPARSLPPAARLPLPLAEPPPAKKQRVADLAAPPKAKAETPASTEEEEDEEWAALMEHPLIAQRQKLLRPDDETDSDDAPPGPVGPAEGTASPADAPDPRMGFESAEADSTRVGVPDIDRRAEPDVASVGAPDPEPEVRPHRRRRVHSSMNALVAPVRRRSSEQQADEPAADEPRQRRHERPSAALPPAESPVEHTHHRRRG